MFTENGKVSLVRVLATFIVACIMLNWMIFNIKTGTMSPMPFEQVIMVLGALLGKIVQKPFEKKGE